MIFVKIISILDKELFPKRTSDAPLHTLSKLYDVPIGFVTSPSFEAVYCYICAHQRVAVARSEMSCLVPIIGEWGSVSLYFICFIFLNVV